MNQNEIADKLNGKALDEVISLFQSNPSYFDYAGLLMSDERMRVRLATTSLLEELVPETPDLAGKIIPLLLPLLGHSHNLVRGDAANLIAILGGRKYIPDLKKLALDPDRQVREVIEDILSDLEQSFTSDKPDNKKRTGHGHAPGE